MLNLFIANLKLLLRNRQQLFWSLMFPLIFTVIFGFFFGKGSMSTGTVAIINQSNSPLAQTVDKTMSDSSVFKVQKDTDLNTSKDQLQKGKISAIVLIPTTFGDQTPDAARQLTIISDPANLTTNQLITGFLNQILTQANFQASHAAPIYSINEENTNTLTFSYFDFIMIGLVGMALMNASIQGVAISMSNYRDEQILKRLTTTPLPSWKFIITNVLARLILNIIQITLILLVGIYGFSGHVNGSIAVIYGLGMVGAILFQLIGFAIASIAKTTQGAEGMSTAVAIPMMFLAGVFFPVDQLPKWLYSIVQYLPLAPLLRMIRDVGLEDLSPFNNLFNVWLVVIWIFALLVFTSLRFRLSEE